MPQQLAVVGFDGLPEAAHYWPPLTTVYQDLRKLGCAAVQALIQAINANHQDPDVLGSKSTFLCPGLIVRESSDAARVPVGFLPSVQNKIPCREMT